jgi:uncharacterized protein
MKFINLVFLNNERSLRNSWWVVVFFVILSLLLSPVIILADKYGFEITIWYQVLIIAGASFTCQTIRRKPLHELIGKVDGSWFTELFIGLLIGILLMILPALFVSLTGSVHWQINEMPISAFVSGISTMLSVVLAEELLFRGFVFQRFIDAFGHWPAQIIIAGLFLLTHLNNPGMTGTIRTIASVNIFIASIFFGIAYVKTKNLGMPIGIHFMANFTEGTFLGFGVSGEKEVSLLTPIITNTPDWITGGVFGLEASIVGLSVLILLTASLYLWYPSEA